MKTPVSPLSTADTAYHILPHLDPSSLLALRLVSASLNAIILSLQKSLCRTIFQRTTGGLTLSFLPYHTEADREEEEHNLAHLRTLVRLPKAYELARSANTQLHCFTDVRRERRKGTTNEWVTIMEPIMPLYRRFLARCARAILIIWTLNDIRRHLHSVDALPNYVAKDAAPPFRMGKLARLLIFRKMAGKLEANSVAETNAANSRLFINTLAPRSSAEVESHLFAVSIASRKYLESLDRSLFVDLIWVQHFVGVNLALSPPYHSRNSHKRTSGEEVDFMLQQSPSFMLSVASKDIIERDWAWKLAREVVRKRQVEVCPSQWTRREPFWTEDAQLGAESYRAKAELTRGDWQDRGDGRAWQM